MPDYNYDTTVPFAEALSKFEARTPVPSSFTSAEWGQVPVGMRELAFWSARQEDAKFVQAMRDGLSDALNQTTITLPDGRRAFKVNGRTDFIRQMGEMIEANGIPRLGPRGSIVDIGSNARLGLIYDTNIASAYAFGHWKQGISPVILQTFPALRFIRVRPVKTPRALHNRFTNAVRRKDDLAFWLAMNSPAIGGFGVPWGPWGFNSGMDVEDVDRAEAESLGLVAPGK